MKSSRNCSSTIRPKRRVKVLVMPWNVRKKKVSVRKRKVSVRKKKVDVKKGKVVPHQLSQVSS